MAFGFIAGAAVATVAAALVTGSRVVGFRRILKNATLVDVVFTVGMGVAFAGTLTGLLVAIAAGLLMAVFLTGAKKCLQVWDAFKGRGPAANDEFDANGVWIYNKAPYVG